VKSPPLPAPWCTRRAAGCFVRGIKGSTLNPSRSASAAQSNKYHPHVSARCVGGISISLTIVFGIAILLVRRHRAAK